ncbi:MAG TPA: hypothetical protein VHO24_16055 [Opitutaceae bacterium]|nr:hypothetical protein [Opitutaceae bacterium]
MKPPPVPWQEFTRRGWRRLGWVGAMAAALLSVTPAQSADDDEEKEEVEELPKESAELARKYAAVVGWRGFFQTSETGTISWTGFYSAGAETVEFASHGQFTLERSTHWSGEDVRRGVLTWGGSSNKAICGEQVVSYYRQLSNWFFKGTGSERRMQASGSLPMTATEFTIWLPSKKRNSTLVHIHPGGGGSNGKTLNFTTTGRSVWDESRGNGTDVRRTRSLDETTQSDSFVHWYGPVGEAAEAPWHQVMRAGPGVLVFPFESTTRADTQISTPLLTRRSRVILCPLYDDLELEVTIDGYETWRPEGSIATPAKPGNSLVARATVKSKTGGVKTLPDVRRFKFQLLDTSREPGICLNWPLKAKDEDYDLRLTAERGGKLSDKDQKLIVTEKMTDEKQQPYAETKIDSYDFGGRATLLVVCELEDGRELMGVVKGAKGEDGLVRLPKMEGPDWIAEAWRKEKKAEKLPALDDNEEVKEQEHKGDGFTLYEEYRGWVEQGKHIEGDPEKKDFFVRNTIGADAKGGIALFERASKLAVHSRLRSSEFSREERLMNGNRRDAPQRVKQHGVYLEKTEGQGSFGGGTSGMAKTDADYAFRPGKVWQVRVEYPTSRDGLFSKGRSASYNLSERDASFAYDRGVAHELLHSVGVDHHGVAGYGWMRYFQSASDPGNPTHRARFVDNPPGKDDNDLTYGPYARTMTPETLAKDLMRAPSGTLLWEDTGQDIAESMAAAFERALAAQRAARAANPPSVDAGERATRFPYYGKDAHFWRESEIFDSTVHYGPQFQLYLTVEEPGGSCSGDELCLMRYYFANAYPAKGLKDTYYVVRPGPGANRAGRELCKDPAGTFHNAASNSPRPRFGDAADKRGNCFKYICPNDAIAPRKL